MTNRCHGDDHVAPRLDGGCDWCGAEGKKKIDYTNECHNDNHDPGCACGDGRYRTMPEFEFEAGDRVIGRYTGSKGEIREVDPLNRLVWIQYDQKERTHGWIPAENLRKECGCSEKHWCSVCYPKGRTVQGAPEPDEDLIPAMLSESETWVEEAQRIVGGSRREDYGDAEDMTAKIAAVWSQYLGIEVTPRQFCMLMVLLKVMRDSHKTKRDNMVDLIGYTLLAEKNEQGAR